jgi:hypothetical protein
MRPRDLQFVEDRKNVPHAQDHFVGLGVVRFVTSAVPAVVDEDQPELMVEFSKLSSDRRPSRQLDRIEESAEEDDRRTVAAIVLEVHAAPVEVVRREWHRRALSS